MYGYVGGTVFSWTWNMWNCFVNKVSGKFLIDLESNWKKVLDKYQSVKFSLVFFLFSLQFEYQEDLLSIWNKTATDQATIARIRDTLKRILNLPPNTPMEYKTHCDSLKWVLTFLKLKIELKKIFKSFCFFRASKSIVKSWSNKTLTVNHK